MEIVDKDKGHVWSAGVSLCCYVEVLQGYRYMNMYRKLENQMSY